MEPRIRDLDGVFALLDALVAPVGGDWWDRFYADRSRQVPFFVDKPDEHLAAAVEQGVVRPGRALDLGCGPGRNALHLAAAGFAVDAVDLSATAVAWAREQAAAAALDVGWLVGDAFTADLPGPYDLVVDSGCFHHLPPHRRVDHLQFLDRVLAPGGVVCLTCFTPEGGIAVPDVEVYRAGRRTGGIGFTAADLRWIFAGYEELALRPMVAQAPDSPLFGESFLWAVLLRRG
ncbi:class I SAM-dependent methyltransferase [Pseudonocardia sp. CA-107938]|uniref:class I SAM-dependent methyltransferase n=1 Tax=Pseudonocardia sp. CA-107938 TaxID=3240021 RepID=UPI003D92DA9B